MVGQLQLWSGYVLFFLSSRICSIMRLACFRSCRRGPAGSSASGATRWAAVVWRAVRHFILALWSLFRRRRLSFVLGMAAVDLGSLVIPLGGLHFVGARLATSSTASTGLSLGAGPMVAGEWMGRRQFGLPMIVWLHGCIGLHFGWRLRPW